MQIEMETKKLSDIELENKEFNNSDELYRYLVNRFKEEDISDCLPLNRICQVLIKHSNTLNIGIEREYYCKDFMAEYSYFYSKLFSRVNPNCSRIHFWKGEEINEENYLGYCVLRPLNLRSKGKRLGKVGRTVIAYPESNQEYLLLRRAEYEANIKGNRYSIGLNVAPFIQQDTQVGTCAQSAIWMAARYLHGRFRFREYFMDEINDMATRYLAAGPILPSSGLIEEQMIECIRGMGYIPLFYPIEENDYPDGIIYRYMESGIPVILIIKYEDEETKEYIRHAVVVVGHNFNPKQHTKISQTNEILEKDFKYYTPLSWINYFLIHDDARGPYLPMWIRREDIDILATSEEILKTRVPFFVYPDYKDKEKKEIRTKLESILIPLPKEVALRGETAEVKAYDLITDSEIVSKEIEKLISSNYPEIENNSALQKFIKARNDKNLVLRTYLRPSNEYKVYLEKNGPIEFLREKYRSLHLPKYIWIIEISLPELFANETEVNRMMLGEVIFDATDSEFSEAYLIIHLPCICIMRDAITGKRFIINALEQRELKEDVVYGHRINSEPF